MQVKGPEYDNDDYSAEIVKMDPKYIVHAFNSKSMTMSTFAKDDQIAMPKIYPHLPAVNSGRRIICKRNKIQFGRT